MNIDDLRSDLVNRYNYDPATGQFTYKIFVRYKKPGDKAGTVDKRNGHVNLKVAQGVHKAHRMAWLYVHGVLPPDSINHINHDKADNRIENLRLATASENMHARPVYKNNKSGFKGVTWNKKDRLWVAKIYKDKKEYYLGSGRCKYDCAQLYNFAAASLAGDFATYNLPSDPLLRGFVEF